MTPQLMDAERDFTGNPNPPPMAPEPRGGGAVATQEPPESGGVPSASAVLPEAQAKSPDIFRVVNNDEGGQDVFRLSDEGEEKWGKVTLKGAVEVLRATAKFDPLSQSWDVPESVALDLIQKRLPLPVYWKAKYRQGEASIIESDLGLQVLSGKLSQEEGVARSEPALLAVQLKEAPMFAWQGDFGGTVVRLWNAEKEAGGPGGAEELGNRVMTAWLAEGVGKTAVKMGETVAELGVGGVARRAAGSAAQFLPTAEMGAAAAGQGAAVAGAGGLLALAAAGPEAVAAGVVASPVTIKALGALMASGAYYGIYESVARLETGSTAIALSRKKVDLALVRKIAPIAGMMKGALEVMGFKFLTAPLKRAAVNQVLSSEIVKSVMKKWYVSYLTATGGEAGTETAQTAVDQAAQTLAAIVERRPELLLSEKDVIDDLFNTYIETFMGAGLLAVPGAALEGGVARIESAAEKAATAKITAAVAEFEKTAAARDQAQAAPVAAETVTESRPAPEAPPGDVVLEKFEKGEASTAEVMSEADKILATANEGLETKTHEAEVEGRIRELEETEKQIRREVADKKLNFEMLERHKAPTRRIGGQIKALVAEWNAVTQEIDTLKARSRKAIVAPGDTLAFKPAEIEDLVEMGLSAGQKEHLGYGKKILEVAKALKLSRADIRAIVKDRLPAFMGPAEFTHFMEGQERLNPKTGEVEYQPGFVELAEQRAEWKRTYEETNAVRKEKAIRNERYIRELHGLPALKKMSKAQLENYAEILGEYDKNDTALTVKNIKALEGGKGEGVKSVNEGRRRLAELSGKPAEAFKGVKVTAWMLAAYDSLFAKLSALHQVLVDGVKEALAGGEMRNREFERTVDRLASAAIASRRKEMSRGRRFMARMGDFLAPQQRELAAFIQEEDPTMAAEEAATFTPEELAFAEFAKNFHEAAFAYLQKVNPALTSRFEGTYLFNTRRPMAEVVRDFLTGQTGMADTLKDVMTRVWQLDEQFYGDGSPGSMLSYRKFMRQTQYRQGKIIPSANVALALKRYGADFHRKVALDEAIPWLETAARVSQEQSRDVGVKDATRRVVELTHKWLRMKKGDARAALLGEDLTGELVAHVEPFIRFAMLLSSIKFISFKPALQVASAAGETQALYMHLGEAGMIQAGKRWATKQGRAIVEKYDALLGGEGVFHQAVQPEKTLGDQINLLGWGIYQVVNRAKMGTLILGGMTEAEFKAGELSMGRWAAIQREAGDWLDLRGSKSVVGATVMGSSATQFKSWAVPQITSIIADTSKVAQMLAGKREWEAKPFLHFQRLAVSAGIAASLTLLALKGSEEEDSLRGIIIKRICREILSPFQVMKPAFFLQVPVAAAMTVKWGLDLTALLPLVSVKGGRIDFSWDRYRSPTSPHYGELKGTHALLRDAPVPSFILDPYKQAEAARGED